MCDKFYEHVIKLAVSAITVVGVVTVLQAGDVSKKIVHQYYIDKPFKKD